MFQKLEMQSLQGYSHEDLVAYKTEVEKVKASLEDLKAKGGKTWTDAAQAKLNDLAVHLVSVDELIAAKAPAPEESKPAKKEIPAGMENSVVLEIVRGKKFNPDTGKRVTESYIQAFSFSEWQVFKKHYKELGYLILKVINDPFGGAEELVEE